MTIDDEKSCYFFIRIHTPHGLERIGPALAECLLPLYAWESGYNGKTILRANLNEDGIEWEMDSSDIDEMVASGCLAGEAPKALVKLQSLSDSFAKAGYPHEILLDGPDGHLFRTIQFDWKEVGTQE